MLPRSPPPSPAQEDYVELGGVRIHKPFVEKPSSGEDHNVYIYYPHSMVGLTCVCEMGLGACVRACVFVTRNPPSPLPPCKAA